MGFTPHAEYAFHHPLIRAVAYESQLKSDRAEVHRRLAAAIESRSPESADENAALIAEHLQAAGDLHAAYGWHMRAGSVVDQPRHRRSAGQLGTGPPTRRRVTRRRPRTIAMRIAPRTMLCGTGWRVDAAHRQPLLGAAGVVQRSQATRRRWLWA